MMQQFASGAHLAHNSILQPLINCCFHRLRTSSMSRLLSFTSQSRIQFGTGSFGCQQHRPLGTRTHFFCISINDSVHRATIHCKRFMSSDLNERESEWRRSPKTSVFSLNNRIMRRDRTEGQALFRDLISKKDSGDWSIADWDEVAALISSNVKGPWEALCMQTLYADRNVELGRSLMNYLEGKDDCPNRVVVPYFIALLGATSGENVNQDQELKKYYDDFMSATDLLDAATIEVLIKGLAYSSHYLECLKLLEICRETHNPGSGMLFHVLLASLRYHDMDLCELILSEYEQAAEPTQLQSLAAEIVGTSLTVGNERGLTRVMEFMKKHGLLIPKKQLDEIVETFHSHQPGKWTETYGYIHHKGGNCVVCRHQMDRLNVTDEEFSGLRSAFTDQVIVGSNIFYKSTPEELKHFMDFVERNGPFDVVIDGLNVIHKGPKPPRRERLERAVAYFAEANKKILILGSKALKVSASNFRRSGSKPTIYMTSTTKADDVFFLYAAIHSSKDTLIVSFDKLRDHKFRLERKLRPIFHKWLQSVQIYDWFFSRYGDFGIRRRHLFSIGPAKDDGGWHFPVNDCDKDAPYGKLGVLCLRHGKRRSPPPRVRRSHQKSSTGVRLGTDARKEWFET
ncbi:mitochondrial ribonuclease P catalytic subunit [Aplysia californica]|uniref:Mitochondrial ribonuclease P catalytic subunit n=1 Tax=Aplysia californica TaxID=6500 RepID=A0ABM0ZVB0_APLCA|nr:mitochondrial ribonuclease P catalytic subunit [Aplysia californica]XP_012935224.1 mitochondrial ribonuclease P catalytic subunit [Aplysia californica]